MYYKVSFKYEDVMIDNVCVAVYPSYSSDLYYVVMGIPFKRSFPYVIGQAGVFKDANSALECVKLIAEKYPRVENNRKVPEFIGI
ncbi:MAG: hypothetical protein NC253_01370 [Ruminococcus sp.]|nr:hypothetical protein [Ruminococcus sp.]MCM1380925.1 hypothetical protein [Muribaculaceae bacterium]MCM1480478.1 hypothetical protein [Muribaculaceae bacterium]